MHAIYDKMLIKTEVCDMINYFKVPDATMMIKERRLLLLPQSTPPWQGWWLALGMRGEILDNGTVSSLGSLVQGTHTFKVPHVEVCPRLVTWVDIPLLKILRNFNFINFL